MLLARRSQVISCSRWIEHQWCKSYTFGINFHMSCHMKVVLCVFFFKLRTYLYLSFHQMRKRSQFGKRF
ncbi:unnamed protein product [Tenebrio molitor]|nr:unnamed protein product [Tenebrio molitor]